jgi:hypothetical protein
LSPASFPAVSFVVVIAHSLSIFARCSRGSF